MTQIYSALAHYYDKFSHKDCDYVSWSQYLYAVAQKHNVTSVVDIACGTGKMTQLLAKQGYKVVGVDNSVQMLSNASGKCNAKFVLQDMRKLQLPTPVDMAVCVNDGVNYLAPTQLQAFFTKVASNLHSGAPFVFDVSSPYKLQNVLGNNVFYVDDENATLLWSNQYKKDKATLSLTFFVKNANGSYDRQDEQHVQYVHTTQDIATALQNAGFTLQQTSAEYGKKLQEDSLRITYYATKN